MNFEFVQKELGFKAVISDTLLNELYQISNSHLPKEFGGILLGKYSETGKDVIIVENCIPTKYRSKRHLFKRFVKNLNMQIKRRYEDSDGELIYVGEWHSHPNGSSLYSQKDLKSIFEIARDQNVKIKSPLLIIIAPNEHTYSYGLYIFHKEKIYTYEKSI